MGNLVTHWDQTAYAVFSLLFVITYGAGIGMVLANRIRSGRWTLLAGLTLLATSNLLSGLSSVMTIHDPDPNLTLWYAFFALSQRMMVFVGTILLMIGLYQVLQRGQFLETLHQEAQED